MDNQDFPTSAGQLGPGDLLRESRWVERLALRLVGDAAAAQDLSQEVMVVLLRRRPDLGQDARPWLGSVVRRLALRWRRDRARDRQRMLPKASRESESAGPVELVSGLPSTDELVAQAELRRWVGEQTLNLPEPGRTVVLLRYFRGLSAAEIARQQQLPSGTVRARLKRALDELRQRIDDRDGEDRDSNRIHWALTALSFPSIQSPGLSPPMTDGAQPNPLPFLEFAMASKAFGLGVAAACIAVATIGIWWFGRDGQTAALGQGLAPAGEISEAETEARALYDVEEQGATRSAIAASSLVEAVGPEVQELAGAELPSAEVYARIVDASGNGIAGAQLRLHGTSLAASSNGSGEVRLTVEASEEPVSAVLMASYPGLAQRFERTMLSSGQISDLGVMELGAAGAISGVVEDSGGFPIEGARVFAVEPGSARGEPADLRSHGPGLDLPVFEVRSGLGGAFRLPAVGTGYQEVWAQAEGYAYAWGEPVEVDEGAQIHDVLLTLTPLVDESRIAGRVLDPAGNPMAGVLVSYSFRHPEGSASASFRTAADGSFSLLLLKQVAHDFRVMDLPAGRWLTLAHDGVLPGTQDLVLQFVESKALSIEVLTAAGAPVADYHVGLGPDPDLALQSALSGLPFVSRRVVNDPAPQNLCIPSNPFVAKVTTAGYEVATLGPYDPAGAPERLTVRLVALPVIEGVVFSGGKPMAGVDVSIRALTGPRGIFLTSGYATQLGASQSKPAVSDSLGRFQLQLRGKGKHVIQGQAPGFALGETEPMEIDGSLGISGIELFLGLGGSIEGRVLVPVGKSPAGTIVAINRADGFPRTLRVDADGRYSFEGLTPGPWQVIEVQAEYDPRLPFFRMGGMAFESGIPWDGVVRAGEVARIDLDLRERDVVSLAGSLTFSGKPRSGWTFSVRPGVFQSDQILASGAIGDDGKFALELGTDEDFVVECSGAGGLMTISDARSSTAADAYEWSVDLPCGRLEGRLSPALIVPGRPLIYRWQGALDDREIKVLWHVESDGQGRFVLDPVPAGNGTLGYWKALADWQSEWTVLADISISEGSLETIDL